MSPEQDQEASASEVSSAINDAQKALAAKQYDRAQAIAAVAIAEAMTRIVSKIERATTPQMWRKKSAA